DQAVGKRYAIDQHAHGHRRGVPAARRQALEQRILGRFLVEVEGLRVVVGGEALDLRGVERPRSAGESLPDVEIFEVKAFGHSESARTGMPDLSRRGGSA